MMQMHGSKADASKLHRLEQSLGQERSEVNKLQAAVARLEQANQEVCCCLNNGWQGWLTHGP